MVSAAGAFLFIAIVGAALALWASPIQRRARGEAVPRTLASMSHVGRILFAVMALAFVVFGIVVQSGIGVAGGIAFMLAAAGQHWVHEQRRVASGPAPVTPRAHGMRSRTPRPRPRAGSPTPTSARA